MEKITAKLILNYLQKDNVEFFSTQYQLSIPIINRIYKKMKYGIKFEPIRINGDLIIDGHHRFVSSNLPNLMN